MVNSKVNRNNLLKKINSNTKVRNKKTNRITK